MENTQNDVLEGYNDAQLLYGFEGAEDALGELVIDAMGEIGALPAVNTVNRNRLRVATRNAMKRAPGKVRQMAQNIAVNVAKDKIMGKFLRALTVLAANPRNGIPAETIKQLNAGNLRAVSEEIYVSGVITAGTTKLVQAANSQAVGVQNFDKNYLPENFLFLVGGMNVEVALVDTAIAGTNPARAAAGTYTNLSALVAGTAPGTFASQNIPAAVQNGEVEFNIDGTNIMKVAASRFFKIAPAITSGTSHTPGNGDFVPFENILALPPRKTFELNFNAADGVALPASPVVTCVRIKLVGVALRPR